MTFVRFARSCRRTGLNITRGDLSGIESDSPLPPKAGPTTFLLETTEKAVKFAASLGLDVMYVTEDTSRCDPEMVKRFVLSCDQFWRTAPSWCATPPDTRRPWERLPW